MSNWKRLTGRIVYQNDWKTVHEDEVIRPDGRSATYAWIETPPEVRVVAINDDKEICLVHEERYTTGELSLELPGGHIEGEDELDAAKRELTEETGLHADHWERLSSETLPFIGTAASRTIFFVATGLHEARGGDGPTDDTVTKIQWAKWSEVKKMLKDGAFVDGQTISGLALAGLHVGQIK